MKSFVSGRVALLGDAVSIRYGIAFAHRGTKRILQAHAMSPHQGSGAGQAMEVGLVLDQDAERY